MSIERRRRMAGVTLIELIVAMVIVGVALAGLVAAYSRASLASVDPLVTQQMVAIAETMMEEVTQKPFAPEANNGAGRAFFNDVRDYQAYPASSITSVNGDAIPALARYRVAVAVDQPVLTGMNAGDALRIRVTVSVQGGGVEPLVLTGWRIKP